MIFYLKTDKMAFYILLWIFVDVCVNAEYAFHVLPVEKCPLSKEDWEMRSNQLQCNKTHGYHCVPNKNRSSLIEFCYPKGFRIPFEKGNCVELAGYGILNQVPCTTFSSGCPETFFFSNDLYNYFKCLAINTELGCFDADVDCIVSRTLEKTTSKQDIKTTEGIPKEKQNADSSQNDTPTSIIGVLVSLIVIMTISGIVIGFVILRKWKTWKRQLDANASMPLLQNSERLPHENEDFAKCPKNKETGAALQCSDTHSNDDDQEVERLSTDQSLFHDIENHASLNDGPLSIEGDPNTDLPKLHDALVKNDEQEFNLLIKDIDKHSLNMFNNRGFNSLHLSAKGGNLKCFCQILKSVDINSKAVDGRNCLHIAAYNGSYSICKFIFQNHKQLFSERDVRYNMNPAHWAALGGQESILELIMKFDYKIISEKTPKYEENIVLFACMGQSVAVCEFVKNCKENEISELLHALNSEGWNAIQYAAKSGSFEVFEFLVANKVDIRNKSKQTHKNCLHTACERGHKDICQYILKLAPDLIETTDKYEQHVGHFAVKSGDTEILHLLLQKTKEMKHQNKFLAKGTTHNINILHIACRHARYDMCVAIVKQFPDLINEITEKGWNAALFITEKAGAEKERVKILKFLEKHKLNVFHVSRSGKTILYNACVNRSKQLVQYLLKYYPDLLNIEKSMDPSKAAKSEEIENIFKHHYEEIRKRTL